MHERRGTEDPSGLGIYPNWAWSWPANRRVLYNRASCDPSGQPWDEYMTDWARAERIHPAPALLDALGRCFTEEHRAEGPYFYPDLAGTSVLVTGGTSGLGRAMAQALVDAGARVALTSRERSRADAVAAGWFGTAGKVVQAVERITGLDAQAVYITLNPTNPALLARRAFRGCHARTS